MSCTQVALPTTGVVAVTRLLPGPFADPTPFEEMQDELDLDLAGRSAPLSRPGLRLVTGDAPELDAFATRFAQAVVEVIGGDRGVHQLMRWTTSAVYADMARRSHTLNRAAPIDRRHRRLRAQVRSVHITRPYEGVAEISIHVRHGQRSRAIAACITLIEGRWRCSALEFG